MDVGGISLLSHTIVLLAGGTPLNMNTAGKRRIGFNLAVWIIATAISGVAAFAEENAAEHKKEPVGLGTVADKGDVAELKRQLSEQQKQIDELRHLVEKLRESNKDAGNSVPTASQPASRTPALPDDHDAGLVASAAPMVPPAAAATTTPALPRAKQELAPESSPLSFHIGSAYLTPVGFMDFTSVWRSTAPGSGIGTNFGSIPFGNTTQGNLSELRFSTQNSRIGSRVDAIVKGAHVIGYWESDFLGFAPGNVAVSSNSDSFRLRLYWVDLQKGKWEVLGGQSWSLLTPGRKGISPLPGDLFYTQDMDVNYQLGLTWSRDPQFRFVFHPSNAVAMGISLENPEQYIGGSAGGGLTTLPSTLITPYASQLDNGSTTLSAPGLHPDIVAKIAFDPKLPGGRDLHFEFGGTARTFKVWNPLASQSFRATGSAGQANLNIELFRGLRFITNNYWGDGGGRYIFGQSPDLIVRSDGSISPVHAGSTVTGFEYTAGSSLLYGYYGGVYISRNTTIDAATGKFIGYGYSGSPGSQNRTIQEGTIGFIRTFWKDAKYGALSLITQYSYVVRNPWSVAPEQPKNAKTNMIFLDLRYSLPGSAPKLE